MMPSRLVLFAAGAMLLITLALLDHRQWYEQAPLHDPLYGVSFSCKRTQYLDQDCRAVLTALLDDLGVRHVRLSLYWSDAEQTPGVYDWSSIDWQLDLLESRGARAVVSVGMKAQRYPEFWLPTWLRLTAAIPPNEFPEDHPLVVAHLFPYLEAATRHLAAHPAVEGIQVENEPFVHFQGHANGWHLRKPFVAREVATVRDALAAVTGEQAGAEPAPPGATPRIVISHASWLRRDRTWQWILEHADAVAQSVYTKRQRGPWRWLYIFPYRFGPLTPDLPAQARAAAGAGKELWIGELQAEPFEQPRVDVRGEPLGALGSFSPRWLDDNVQLARRSGAARVYLWGVEWWAYLRDTRGDATLWERARPLFRGAADNGAPPPQPPP